MKIVFAGCQGQFENLLLNKLLAAGHEITVICRKETDFAGFPDALIRKTANLSNPEIPEELFTGADLALSTLTLTDEENRTPYEVDYEENRDFYQAAQKAGVPKFAYLSMLGCDKPGSGEAPLTDAKYLMEDRILRGEMEYLIFRPTFSFEKLLNAFLPALENGTIELLHGNGDYRINPLSLEDLARFIAEHLEDSNTAFDLGGKETYTWTSLANLFFKAAGKEPRIKYTHKWIFNRHHRNEEGREKERSLLAAWTLSHHQVGITEIEGESFEAFLTEQFTDKA